MKIIKNIILTIILFIFISNAQIVISSSLEASYTFFNKVFISTFLFIILADILIYFDYHIFINKLFGKLFSKVFNISKNSTIIIILSLLSSHPSNTLFIKDKLDNNEITLKEAEKLYTFTTIPSIMFVIGTIGISIFNSFKIGLILLITNYLYNFLIGLFLRNNNFTLNSFSKNLIKKDNFFNVIKKAIIKSINTSFIILGNLTIFITIINILNKYISISPILLGLLEMTSGIINISTLNIATSLKITLISFLLNFSGLSVIFQGASVLSDYKFNYIKITTIKLLFSIITSIILYIFLNTISI